MRYSPDILVYMNLLHVTCTHIHYDTLTSYCISISSVNQFKRLALEGCVYFKFNELVIQEELPSDLDMGEIRGRLREEDYTPYVALLCN